MWATIWELDIVAVPHQYIVSLLLFTTENKDQFITHSQIDRITTRQSSDLYVPAANLTIHEKVVYYQGIKIYHHLPKTVKYLSGDKNKIKIA